MLDFRALSVMVEAIDNAGPIDLKQAVADCRAWGNYMTISPSKRKIWKGLATFLNANSN